jgi:hypothetical protein
MARHKYSSNVCEKALITADPENRRLLIDEVITPKQDDVNPIGLMMKDQFASAFWMLSVSCLSKASCVLQIMPSSRH